MICSVNVSLRNTSFELHSVSFESSNKYHLTMRFVLQILNDSIDIHDNSYFI